MTVKTWLRVVLVAILALIVLIVVRLHEATGRFDVHVRNSMTLATALHAVLVPCCDQSAMGRQVAMRQGNC